jgi:hypothetical protein
MGVQRDFAIVAGENFILAARDVGYASVAEAIAELIDNSIQAQARTVRLFIGGDVAGKGSDVAVSVLDDGCGMSGKTLRMALQFGGTERFDDRSGQGRFGMGLPSSSLSQARRLELYSWTKYGQALYCYLDVDELREGRMREIPPPRKADLPEWAQEYSAPTGTLVVWRKCDRLGKTRTPVAEKELRTRIGGMFRYFIWNGVQIFLDGTRIAPIDPLFCHRETPLSGAKLYGKPLTYKFRLPGAVRRSSTIRVRFSELPVADWHNMTVAEKRRWGIVKGAGVSLVRAGREVAYGWYFMGKKRKENYDDWWRCEIAFTPELDEYFRPTYTKQAINPRPELEAVLTSDLEAISHALNARARRAYSAVKSGGMTPAAGVLSRTDRYLPPIPEAARPSPSLSSRSLSGVTDGKSKYSLSVEPLRQEAFYTMQRKNGTLVLILNRDHPFFDRVYAPLCCEQLREMRAGIDCLLFSLARAEAEAASAKQRYWYSRKRVTWSNILAAFLGS